MHLEDSSGAVVKNYDYDAFKDGIRARFNRALLSLVCSKLRSSALPVFESDPPLAIKL